MADTPDAFRTSDVARGILANEPEDLISRAARSTIQRMRICFLTAATLALFTCLPCSAADSADTRALPTWNDLPSIHMKGRLRAFWNVGGRDREANELAAADHGLESVALLNTYSDYPGRQKEKIVPAGSNPWDKPPFFERIVRRNIDATTPKAIFVHDVEFHFEEDTDALWTNPVIRAASHATSPRAFRDAYYREWASWFALPCQWAKEKYPDTPVGIYGPQPFRRDYWGVAGKEARQIDGTHKTDAELWQHIAPAVDFCVASIYCFYDDPGSVYYMGANVEENVQRMRACSDKPVYAYLWLRYHDSNAKLKDQEVADYLAEAMAVLPYFCGARATVLWGWEPKGQGPYYRTLPVFMRSLTRVAGLSEEIARATPLNDAPIHAAWKAKAPLIRKLRISGSDWLVLATHPWQADTAATNVIARCGTLDVPLAIRGKHTEIYRVTNGHAAHID